MSVAARRVFAFIVGAGLLALATACHRDSERAPDSQPFTQAPEAVRRVWDLAVAADKTNDYATAQTLFYGLLREQLTPQQRQAVDEASTALNQRFLKSLQSGDPGAKAALAELRRNPPNRPH